MKMLLKEVMSAELWRDCNLGEVWTKMDQQSIDFERRNGLTSKSVTSCVKLN